MTHILERSRFFETIESEAAIRLLAGDMVEGAIESLPFVSGRTIDRIRQSLSGNVDATVDINYSPNITYYLDRNPRKYRFFNDLNLVRGDKDDNLILLTRVLFSALPERDSTLYGQWIRQDHAVVCYLKDDFLQRMVDMGVDGLRGSGYKKIKKDVSFVRWAVGVVVHELTHMFDDWRSKGKYISPGYKTVGNSSVEEYMSQDLEVNAFFSQIVSILDQEHTRYLFPTEEGIRRLQMAPFFRTLSAEQRKRILSRFVEWYNLPLTDRRRWRTLKREVYKKIAMEEIGEILKAPVSTALGSFIVKNNSVVPKSVTHLVDVNDYYQYIGDTFQKVRDGVRVDREEYILLLGVKEAYHKFGLDRMQKVFGRYNPVKVDVSFFEILQGLDRLYKG